jgi:uncharacterized membrane protein YbhN (UPF0104 family)
LVFVAILIFWVRGLDWARALTTLKQARPALVLVAWLLLFAYQAMRAARWRVMLPAERRPGWVPIIAYYLVANGLGDFLPAGSRDAIRIYLLKRRHGVGILVSTAVILLEKVLDAFVVLLFSAALPFLLVLPAAVSTSIEGFTSAGVAASVAVLAMARSEAPPFVRRWSFWARLSPAFVTIRGTRSFAEVLAISMTGNLLLVLFLLSLLRSLDIAVPGFAAGLLLFAGAFTSSIPGAPGSTSEVGVVAALTLFGVPGESALAYALLLICLRLSFAILVLPWIGWLLDSGQSSARSATNGVGGARALEPNDG